MDTIWTQKFLDDLLSAQFQNSRSDINGKLLNNLHWFKALICFIFHCLPCSVMKNILVQGNSASLQVRSHKFLLLHELWAWDLRNRLHLQKSITIITLLSMQFTDWENDYRNNLHIPHFPWFWLIITGEKWMWKLKWFTFLVTYIKLFFTCSSSTPILVVVIIYRIGISESPHSVPRWRIH